MTDHEPNREHGEHGDSQPAGQNGDNHAAGQNGISNAVPGQDGEGSSCGTGGRR